MLRLSNFKGRMAIIAITVMFFASTVKPVTYPILENDETNDVEAANMETAVAPKSSETKDKKSEFDFLDYPDVEVKPLLNGKDGGEEFRKYYMKNYKKLSEIAKKNGVQGGHIIYQFFIDKDGTLIDAKIRESPHPLLSAEMLRLINTIEGKWTPGKHDGETIKVRFVTAVRFNQ